MYRTILACLALVSFTWSSTGVSVALSADAKKPLRAGIIGLDTSHVIAFTKSLNADSPKPELAGCRVVAAYPKGSPDIKSSVERVPMYTEQLKQMGVEIVNSIKELTDRVDVVFLETNDGRPHLEQFREVLNAKKPTFIDKPIAGSLKDAVLIFKEAAAAGVPVFSSSSLRYGKDTQEARAGKYGKIVKCETTSPASLESTHPDLFWYGIHGVEALFTVMGTGCESVVRTQVDGKIVVQGKWAGGRVGTFREDKGYHGTAEGDKGSGPVGSSGGYDPLLVQAIKFFRTGEHPVSMQETLEIYAFMEAADESKRKNGAPVSISATLKAAGWDK